MSEVFLEIDDNSFEQKVLNNDKLVVVDFWAPWCGPCRAMSSVLEQLAETRPEVQFCKVNIDENTAYAAKYAVRSIPTILIVNKGEVVERVVGAIPGSQLEEMLDAHLKK